MGQQVVTVLVALVTITGSALGAWLTTRGNRTTKEIETRASPYAELADRVSVLESQVGTLRARVEQLEDERRVDRAWIRRVIEWAAAEGHRIPFPLPTWHTTKETP